MTDEMIVDVTRQGRWSWYCQAVRRVGLDDWIPQHVGWTVWGTRRMAERSARRWLHARTKAIAAERFTVADDRPPRPSGPNPGRTIRP